MEAHARKNAQAAMAADRAKAEAFDLQFAEERKKNEALDRAKKGEDAGAPLDCKYLKLVSFGVLITKYQLFKNIDCDFSGFGRAQLPEPYFHWKHLEGATQDVDCPAQRLSAQGSKLVGEFVRSGYQWYLGR